MSPQSICASSCRGAFSSIAVRIPMGSLGPRSGSELRRAASHVGEQTDELVFVDDLDGVALGG